MPNPLQLFSYSMGDGVPADNSMPERLPVVITPDAVEQQPQPQPKPEPEPKAQIHSGVAEVPDKRRRAERKDS